MIDLYCRRHHGVKEPCANCQELAAYAERRIGKCPFGEEKPACGRCPIHCYKPEMKARIIAEVRGQQDKYEDQSIALRAIAVARVG